MVNRSMSKMKHLLRKLHIGASFNEHNRLGETGPTINPTQPPSSSSLSASAMTRVGSVESVERTTPVDTVDNSINFNFFEEEYQVQLALAISASDPNSRDDPESVQIKAAEQLSLGYPRATESETLVDFLSLRYGNYVVNYDEKVVDGFYDVYGIASNSIQQGKMPLLVDLQAIPISDNVDLEVISVNRLLDPELRCVEERAYSMLVECRALECGLNSTRLIQKIADIVVDRMGGPVGDAEEMLKRWTIRSYELRKSLNSIILPLGCLDVGLSRHRALLFKVLADKVNLPCRLVKGSYCTGTDEGAVNLVKFDNASEYLIDLMGAPGTLIPAEVPTSYLDRERNSASYLAFDKVSESMEASSDLVRLPKLGSAVTIERSYISAQKSDDPNQTEKFEHEFGKLLPILRRSDEGSSGTAGKISDAHKLKVKDVSNYVINASKNPEFAQKLHAVLLERGAMEEERVHELKVQEVRDGSQFLSDFNFENEQEFADKRVAEEQKNMERNIMNLEYSLPSDTMTEGFVLIGNGNSERSETGLPHEGNRRSVLNLMEGEIGDLIIPDKPQTKMINSVPEVVAGCEIPWERLQIGERIGIGSYGEVYHADLNGTEVAVKKFLDQDLSGAALVQFKCEIEIMLKLRHPNIVLFMGAVTRPPHLSILTEFLPRGSLYQLLHRRNAHIDERRRMKMALDVARGMNYLHTSHPTVVHRDLKSPNLLVDKNWVVKVSDFGLSRLKHHTFLSSKSTAGTPEWMAPEVLRNEQADEKCDVYSFGVILWELATLQLPWTGLNSMQVVGAVGFQNRRLEIPPNVDPTIQQIIRDCWENDPSLRPSFSQLMTRLRCCPRLATPKP